MPMLYSSNEIHVKLTSDHKLSPPFDLQQKF